MKKTMLVVLTLCMILSCFNMASANISADTEFASVTTSLYPGKVVSFTAVTYNIKNYIRVTRCRLYKLENGIWYYVKDLPVPSKVATNTILFGTEKDYSSDIGTGTYKIYTTFEADGHSISRYSNSRTY